MQPGAGGVCAEQQVGSAPVVDGEGNGTVPADLAAVTEPDAVQDLENGIPGGTVAVTAQGGDVLLAGVLAVGWSGRAGLGEGGEASEGEGGGEGVGPASRRGGHRAGAPQVGLQCSQREHGRPLRGMC